ncbi:MAG: ABC transporter ATP-binding protein/permease [Paludibacteraceae bacterium]|nr:ABC transporter ATP-binding protein/permease [Paludibacteraceae bacterium]
MKTILILLKRFAKPYKKLVATNFLCNILATIFSLFSFATIIPVLQILFNVTTDRHEFQTWEFTNVNDFLALAKNNIFWKIEQIIDTSGATTALMWLGLFLVVTTFIKTGTSYLASITLVPVRTGVLRDLRNQIYNKILNLNIGYFTEERKGDIISRMTGDVVEVEASIISSLEMIFKNPIMILVYFITLFTISWKLSVFVLVLLPVSGAIINRIGHNLKHKSLDGQIQTGEMVSQIDETLGSLRVVKAFNAESKLMEKFSALNNKLRKTLTYINLKYLLAHPTSEFLGTVVIAILLLYGGWLIIGHQGGLDAADFIYYLVIFYCIIPPFKELSKATYSVHKGLASLQRIDEVLNAQNPLDNGKQQQISEFKESIEVKDVWFKYREQWVLKNVSLTIPKGKTIAIVGQSGSGKSTLVDLLPRFYDVIEGSIAIDGINIKDLNTKSLRGLMGNVNQESILFNDTFFNNIAFGVEHATQEEVEAAAKIANAHEFIMNTDEGYQTKVGDRGCKLSGGQRQRISIARAILKNPPILILDEATSALDTESERLVQSALENLMKNRTTIVIAHRLSTIKSADEICVMCDGEIVERGRHEELIKLNGQYKKLCDMQSF